MEQHVGNTRILRISPTAHIEPGMAPVEAYQITFRTPGGHQAHVTVPRSDDWPDVARQMVFEETQRLDGFSESFGQGSVYRTHPG